jgi:hypothetical protein
MATTPTNPMHISDGELRNLTGELVEMHNDLRPRHLEALAGLSEVMRSEAARLREIAHADATRRNFLRGGLIGAGAIGGGVLVAACGSSSDSTGGSASSASSIAGDLKVAQLAASLEVLAVATYGTALSAAGKGSFGSVPPSFGVFATTAQQQHQDHENAWNAALTSAGFPAQKDPDPVYAKTVNGALPGLKTIADVARLALTLETVALETYVAGSGLVTSKANRLVALTIAPVEAQHIAVLNFILGQYPVTDSFVKTDQAASPADLG